MVRISFDPSMVKEIEKYRVVKGKGDEIKVYKKDDWRYFKKVDKVATLMSFGLSLIFPALLQLASAFKNEEQYKDVVVLTYNEKIKDIGLKYEVLGTSELFKKGSEIAKKQPVLIISASKEIIEKVYDSTRSFHAYYAYEYDKEGSIAKLGSNLYVLLASNSDDVRKVLDSNPDGDPIPTIEEIKYNFDPNLNDVTQEGIKLVKEIYAINPDVARWVAETRFGFSDGNISEQEKKVILEIASGNVNIKELNKLVGEYSKPLVKKYPLLYFALNKLPYLRKSRVDKNSLIKRVESLEDLSWLIKAVDSNKELKKAFDLINSFGTPGVRGKKYADYNVHLENLLRIMENTEPYPGYEALLTAVNLSHSIYYMMGDTRVKEFEPLDAARFYEYLISASLMQKALHAGWNLKNLELIELLGCLLYTSPSPRDRG